MSPDSARPPLTPLPDPLLPDAPVPDGGACCPPIRAGALEEGDAALLARQFAALGDPVRLRLLSLLAAAGEPVCACDLVEPAGRSQPTVSHHLRLLREAGLVTSEKRGVNVWYDVVPARLESLRAALGPAGG